MVTIDAAFESCQNAVRRHRAKGIAGRRAVGSAFVAGGTDFLYKGRSVLRGKHDRGS